MSNRPIGVTVLAILGRWRRSACCSTPSSSPGSSRPSWGRSRSTASTGWGVLCAVCSAIFGWLAYALWQLRPAAWVYTWLFAGVALVVAALAVLGASTLSAMLPTITVNGAILAYCFTPGGKRAFAR